MLDESDVYAALMVGLDPDTLSSPFPPRPEWMADGACRNSDPDLFFPLHGESAEAAKGVCDGCEAREECLAFALAEGIEHGVWGGLSPRQRAALGRKREQRPRQMTARRTAPVKPTQRDTLDALGAKTASWRRTAEAAREKRAG